MRQPGLVTDPSVDQVNGVPGATIKLLGPAQVPPFPPQLDIGPPSKVWPPMTTWSYPTSVWNSSAVNFADRVISMVHEALLVY
jgi:hypothetical protein